MRCFKNAVNAINIHGQQFCAKIVLVRDRGKMDHRPHSLACMGHGLGVADINLSQFIVAFQSQWFQVDEPQGILVPQQRQNVRPYSTRWSGNQNSLALHPMPRNGGATD